jgi:hypothetical protein
MDGDLFLPSADAAIFRFVLLRDTALAKGCEHDAPISSVFYDDTRRLPPAEDRPTA